MLLKNKRERDLKVGNKIEEEKNSRFLIFVDRAAAISRGEKVHEKASE